MDSNNNISNNSRRFLNNTGWLLAGRISQMIIQFLVGTFSARYLGPNNYGTINYVASYISFFASFCSLGLNGVIINEYINHSEEEGKITGSAIFLRFLTAILCSIAFLALIYVIDGRNDSTVMIVAVLCAIQLPFTAFDTINFWYQSKLLSKYASIIQTLAFLIVSIYKIFLLVTAKSVYWFAFSTSLDIILLAIFYYAGYQKQKLQKLGYSWLVGKRILKGSIHFIISDMMVYVYTYTDRIMIKQMLGSTTEVGLYSAASVIVGIISFIPISIIDSARPVIMAAKKENEELFKLRVRQTICVVAWISFAYSFFLLLLAKPVIYLIYGKDYIDAALCLRILVWSNAFSFIGGIRSIWLIAEGKNNFVWKLSVLSAITNVLFNLIFVHFYGMNGASIATLLTCVCGLFFPMIFKDTRDFTVQVLYAIIFKNINIHNLIVLIKKR